MEFSGEKKLARYTSSLVLIAVLVSAVSIAIPKEALAQGATAVCAADAVAAALGLTFGKGKGAAAIVAATVARAKAMITNVPVNDDPALPAGEAVTQPDNTAQTTGSVFGKIFDNFKDTCLKALTIDIARFVIRQIRNMVINWINTGNFGGSATFVKNFEFDAKKTAENAARLFASELTGIDFCNYFPVNPAVNLNFRLDARIGLECSFKKSHPEFLRALENPGSLSFQERTLMFAPENDPLLVELEARGKLASAVAKKTTARERQVAAGKGFMGVEKCVEEKTTSPGGWVNTTTGDNCSQADIDAGYCQYLYPTTACAKYEQQTPGSFVADLATEPIKSELRELELVDEFSEAIAAIVNALVGKVINTGLNKVSGP